MNREVMDHIISSLALFKTEPLKDAAIELLKALGYSSEKTLNVSSFAEFKDSFDPNGFLTEENALLSCWDNVDFLFQLTGDEIATQTTQQLQLFESNAYEAKEINSYLFFAIKLAGKKPTRADLSLITRSLNRLVPMPVFVLFKHEDTLSLAIINRRRNLRDGTRDVLTRVSLIRDIAYANPHRAHLDILERFSLTSLADESGVITTFTHFDNAWQKVLSIQELNKRFYGELVNWFNWAVSEIKLAHLPDHVVDSDEAKEKNASEFTVRLICRLLFAWFLKEKKLLPNELLEVYDAVDNIRLPVRDFDSPDVLIGNSYYRGVLQNIFFKALNKPMEKRRKSANEARNDRTVDDPRLKKLDYLGKQYLPDDFDYDLFDSIPYLNGGLFDALPEDNASDTIEDGAISVPNKLFIAKEDDGFTVTAGTRGQRKKVEGINRIFNRYRFTVVENTALEEDVALDPELLGMVFENLLAEINTTDKAAAKSARKESGSYYTPRRIVDYMVNEALHLHLRTRFEKSGANRTDVQLVSQLCYRDEGVDFSSIAERVVNLLDDLRVLDPACGSGAFPMGMLHRVVELLRVVDPGNRLWRNRLLKRLPEELRADAERGMSGKSYDYLRKLGIIQKNLYGVDIQPLASLISKLRFFLTLVIEQEIDPADRQHNYHLHSLPNIETNLLCCNTLQDVQIGLFEKEAIQAYIKARREYYNPELSCEQREELSFRIAEKLNEVFPRFTQDALGINPPPDKETAKQQNISNLQRWFRTATIPAPFFSVRAFFPEIGEAGFHIVIGNPPYGGNKISDEIKNAFGLGSKDPYGAFIARFLNDETDSRPKTPLAADGVLSYIVSDTFMTIKTHRPLRKQMLMHQVYKMLRVHPDTFHATVNTAVILCQRGSASKEHVCQMADLTNVSIHEQYERFLHLLYQTEGFARRQNVSNQTYAIYHYKQSLINTNSNLPFFVASPKLFGLMRDIENEVRVDETGLPNRAYNVSLNDQSLRLFKLGDKYSGTGRTRRWQNIGLFQIMSGIKTGSNAKYLRVLSTDAQKKFDILDEDYFLEDDDAIGLSEEQKKTGITGPKHFVRFEMGMPSNASGGLLPCYYQPPSLVVIDWSSDAVQAMKNEGHSDLANKEFRFQNFSSQISYSTTGQYAPTFRISNAPVFLNMASRMFFCESNIRNSFLGYLNSRLSKYFQKSFINHGIHVEVDDVKELPSASNYAECTDLVSNILINQEMDSCYDYASNEQLEIDRLIYEAYGLNDDDIQEVENWYARRYPKLAKAQRQALAAKQGKTEDELVARKTLHLFCDESRHLPSDGESNFLLGLVSCSSEQVKAAHVELAALWKSHSLPPHFELKWTKVSPGKLGFYKAIVNWFFDAEAVSFRTIILPDKQRMYAALPDESRDYLYYRLYYQLLHGAIDQDNRYRVFMDLKDTRGREKRHQLQEYLRKDFDDISGKVVQNLQHVHSHHVRLLQVCDLLMGAVGFARRKKQAHESQAKREIVSLIEQRIGQSLTMDTPPGTDKMLILTCHDKEALLI